MKKIKLKFVIVLSLIMISFSIVINTNLFADSGFDYDYSYSGDSFSYDIDYGYDDYDYDYDNSSGFDWFFSDDDDYNSKKNYSTSNTKKNNSNSGSSEILDTIFIIIILLIPFLPIISYMLKKPFKKSVDSVRIKYADNDNDYEWLNYSSMESVKALQKVENLIPNFDKKEFLEFAFDVYKRVQEAWQNFDLESVREYLSDEMYNMYVTQLETLKVTGKQNIISDINLRMIEIVDCNLSADTIVISANLLVEQYDYIIKTKNNRVVKGNKYKKLVMQYKLDFEKARNPVNEVICPSCGGILKNIRSGGKCSFCDNDIIFNDPLDYVLTKKTLITQRRQL